MEATLLAIVIIILYMLFREDESRITTDAPPPIGYQPKRDSEERGNPPCGGTNVMKRD